MSATLPAIVFFGTEQLSALSLAALLDAGLPVRLVVTKPDTARGRGRRLQAPAVKHLALAHHIPVLQPTRLADIIPAVTALGRPVGVLVSFGRIIPQAILDLFSPGVINLHPSLLPAYRGPSPIEAAIRNGDAQTGVSIMRLDPRMDAGPVYHQVVQPLRGDEYRADLYDQLGRLGSQALVECLPGIVAGQIQPRPQDEAQASYCRLLTRQDGFIDITTHSAEVVYRHVRAYSGYPGTRIMAWGQPRLVTRAQPIDHPAADAVACRGDSWLRITEMVAPSGRRVSAADFLRGYRDGPGST